MNNKQKNTAIYKFVNLLIYYYLCPNKTKNKTMAEASFTGFVQTVLIIILVFLGLKILLRAFAPSIMRFFLNRMSQRMQKEFERAQNQYQQNAYEQNRSQKQAGKQTIINDNPHSKNPQSTKQVGEYIDYEEI
jgi:hypothetical protein